MATAICNLSPVIMVTVNGELSVRANASGPEGQRLDGMLTRVFEDQNARSRIQCYQVQSRENAVGRVGANLGPRIWDFAAAENQMRAIAEKKKIDFDGLVKAASANFAGSRIIPEIGKSSEEELKRVVNHDDHSIEP